MNAFFNNEHANNHTAASSRGNNNSRTIRSHARIAAANLVGNNRRSRLSSMPDTSIVVAGGRCRPRCDISREDGEYKSAGRQQRKRTRRTLALQLPNRKHLHLAPIVEVASSNGEDDESRSEHNPNYYDEEEQAIAKATSTSSTISATTILFTRSKRRRRGARLKSSKQQKEQQQEEQEQHPSGYYSRPNILIAIMILIAIAAVTIGAMIASKPSSSNDSTTGSSSSISSANTDGSSSLSTGGAPTAPTGSGGSSNNISPSPTTTSTLSPSISKQDSPTHLFPLLPSHLSSIPTTRPTTVPTTTTAPMPLPVEPTLSPAITSQVPSLLPPTTTLSSSPLPSPLQAPFPTTVKVPSSLVVDEVPTNHVCDQTILNITVYTDDYPQQLTWQLIDGNGNYHAEYDRNKYNIPNHQYPIEFYCVQDNACVFSIYDNTGNGYGGHILIGRKDKMYQIGPNGNEDIDNLGPYHLLWINICT